MTMAVGQAVFNAFPKRLFRLGRSRSGTGRGNLIAALIGVGFVCLILWLWLPGILQTWEVSKAPVPVQDANVDNGHCATNFVIVSCSGDAYYLVDAKPYESKISATFFGRSSYDAVAVIRSADRPGLATFDIALEQLANSVIMLLTAVVLLGGFSLYTLCRIPQSRRSTAPLKKGLGINVRPIVVEITGSTSKRRSQDYFFCYAQSGKLHKRGTRFKRGERPFLLAGPRPGINTLGFGLAVLLPIKGGQTVLLNEDLTLLDFTEEERNRLRAARASFVGF
jgi:hypothetical protein